MKLWRHNRESWRFWCHDDDRSRFGKLPEETVEADKGTEGQEESKFLHKHLPFLHPVVLVFDGHLVLLRRQVVEWTLEGMCDVDGTVLVLHFIAVDVFGVILILDDDLTSSLTFFVHDNVVVHVLVGTDGGVVREQFLGTVVRKS